MARCALSETDSAADPAPRVVILAERDDLPRTEPPPELQVGLVVRGCWDRWPVVDA